MNISPNFINFVNSNHFFSKIKKNLPFIIYFKTKIKTPLQFLKKQKKILNKYSHNSLTIQPKQNNFELQFIYIFCHKIKTKTRFENYVLYE